MAVTLSQSPSTPFDMAYGPNPVTLSGIPTDPVTGVPTADKYVLRIFRAGALIADLRQSPNRDGRAIFDIQNTLQSQVSSSAPDFEQTGWIGDDLRNSERESTPFEFQWGYEVGGVVVMETAFANTWLDFGGTKEYYEVPFNNLPYIPAVIDIGGCTNVTTQAQPFTDLNNYRLGADITDGKPAWIANNMRVYDHYVTREDMTTISYYNGLRAVGPVATPVKSIEAFVFYQYNGNTLTDVNPVYNLQANGGGPNTAVGGGAQVVYPYNAITLATGPKNFQDFNSNATHYYVKTGAWTNDTICAAEVDEVTDKSLHYVHRFNIVEADCNDYEHYQFSWLNSFGFRDYYTFKKKKERSLSISRNEFLKEAANYNGQDYDVNIYDRGTTVYSQKLQENYVAYTDYLSDVDARYLEGLFKSPDVRVRFGGTTEFVPISLMSTTWTEKTYRKDRLFQYDIKFKRAHNLKSQRG